MKLYCFSRRKAKEFYSNWKYAPDDITVTSIAGTEDSQKLYLKEEEPHWFNESYNVLNLNFDDIAQDEQLYKGVLFKGLTRTDASRAANFIVKNVLRGKDIYVNCRAGKSRSQGIVKFILDSFPQIKFELNPDNPPTTPNIDVVAKLKRAYYLEGLDIDFELMREFGSEIEKIEPMKYVYKGKIIKYDMELNQYFIDSVPVFDVSKYLHASNS